MQKRKRFGEILVEAKVVSEEALNRALERQRGTGRRLGQVLEDMGVVTEKDIAAALYGALLCVTILAAIRAARGLHQPSPAQPVVIDPTA